MALIVEDGTNKEDADSWVEVADFNTYCASRGYDVTDFDATEKEVALRGAGDFVNTKWLYKGKRATVGQSMEFPRVDLIDRNAYTITGVPLRVKNAQMEAAYQVLAGVPLYQVLDRGGMVKSESVGQLSTTYMDGAPAGRVFEQLQGWLRDYIRDENATDHAPYMREDDNGPYFTTGMMTNTGAGLDDTTSNKE